jgi:hypothetical protein
VQKRGGVLRPGLGAWDCVDGGIVAAMSGTL